MIHLLVKAMLRPRNTRENKLQFVALQTASAEYDLSMADRLRFTLIIRYYQVLINALILKHHYNYIFLPLLYPPTIISLPGILYWIERVAYELYTCLFNISQGK